MLMLSWDVGVCLRMGRDRFLREVEFLKEVGRRRRSLGLPLGRGVGRPQHRGHEKVLRKVYIHYLCSRGSLGTLRSLLREMRVLFIGEVRRLLLIKRLTLELVVFHTHQSY